MCIYAYIYIYIYIYTHTGGGNGPEPSQAAGRAASGAAPRRGDPREKRLGCKLLKTTYSILKLPISSVNCL